MSGRKSMTPRSSETTFNKAAFQVVKCKNCLAEILRKDVERHDESYCRAVKHVVGEQEWRNDVEHGFVWDKDLGGSLIIDEKLLLTSQFHGIPADQLPSTIPNLNTALFLAPELMEHLKFEDAQNVTVHLRRGQQIETSIFTVYTLDSFRPKTLFTVCIKKSSDLYKAFYPQQECIGNKAIIVMDNDARTVQLSKIVLSFEKPKTDPLKYLDACRDAQKLIRNQLIREDQKTIVLEQATLMIVGKTSIDCGRKNRDKEENKDEDKDRDKEEDKEDLSDCIQKLSLTSGPKMEDKSSTRFYKVTQNTKIIFLPLPELCPEEHPLIGYTEQFNTIHKLILDSLDCEQNQPEVPHQRSILIRGPIGTGKTIAMRQLYRRLTGKMNLVNIHPSVFLSKQFDIAKLKDFTDMLIKLSPVVLFLENLEDFSTDKNTVEKRLTWWMKYLLDSLPKSQPIFVIASCTDLELVDTSLRTTGRFELEIDFPIPDPVTRKQILQVEVHRIESSITDEEIGQLAETTHGFTGADLKNLCTIARRKSKVSSVEFGYDLLVRTLKTIKPSVMREISLERPNVFWSDVGGMDKVRQLLEETVVWPIKYPEFFLNAGMEPPRGILMYGPPGCCKTMIGKALATESGLNFFSIKGPELFSKWVGESERAIREIFRRARSASPSILFFDEIDALAAERGQKQSAVGDRVLAQLLTEIDGVEKLSQVVIIAATNRPDIVDKALLRPGRLDSMVYVPLPDIQTRREIFRIKLGKMPLDSSITREDFIEDLAKKSEGYTGAEVTALCQAALLASFRESFESKPIRIDHFDAAFRRVRPRTDSKLIDFYEEFAQRGQN